MKQNCYVKQSFQIQHFGSALPLLEGSSGRKEHQYITLLAVKRLNTTHHHEQCLAMSSSPRIFTSLPGQKRTATRAAICSWSGHTIQRPVKLERFTDPLGTDTWPPPRLPRVRLIQPSFWYCTEPNTTLRHSRLMQSTGESVYHLQSVTFTRTATNETRVLGLQVSVTEQTSALWGEWPTKKQRPSWRHTSHNATSQGWLSKRGRELNGRVFHVQPGSATNCRFSLRFRFMLLI